MRETTSKVTWDNNRVMKQTTNKQTTSQPRRPNNHLYLPENLSSHSAWCIASCLPPSLVSRNSKQWQPTFKEFQGTTVRVFPTSRFAEHSVCQPLPSVTVPLYHYNPLGALINISFLSSLTPKGALKKWKRKLRHNTVDKASPNKLLGLTAVAEYK
jgi:hypothetical protein